MIVSAFGAEGAPLMAALHKEAFGDPWSEGAFVDLMARSIAFAFAAHEGDAPLGFILAWAPLPDAEILTLAVRPDARRRGVGAALTAAAAERAVKAGASGLYLEVAADNHAARALYQRSGFVETGRRRGYYARGVERIDAILMRKALSGAAS